MYNWVFVKVIFLFTGIIEEVGVVFEIEKEEDYMLLAVKGKKVLENMLVGDSIAINGVCLTVKTIFNDFFEVDVSSETLAKTNLKFLKKGDFLNLERALAVLGRINGHFVQGHVDCVTILQAITKVNKSYLFSFKTPSLDLLVPKGSIALNGISLTIVDVTKDIFTVAVIPYTFENTQFSYLNIGDKVNVEYDILAKYVLKALKLKG